MGYHFAQQLIASCGPWVPFLRKPVLRDRSKPVTKNNSSIIHH